MKTLSLKSPFTVNGLAYRLYKDEVLGLCCEKIPLNLLTANSPTLEIREAFQLDGTLYEVRPFPRNAGLGFDDDLDCVPAGFQPGKAMGSSWGAKEANAKAVR